MDKPYDYVVPDIRDWPIYRLLNEQREDFIKQLVSFSLERIYSEKEPEQLSETVARVLYLERARLAEDPWKVDPKDSEDFWRAVRKDLLQNGLDQSAAEQEAVSKELTQRIVDRYAREIIGNFRISTYRFARRTLTIGFSSLLSASTTRFMRWLGGGKNRQRDIDKRVRLIGQIESIRKLAQKGTVVLLPTHFSNLDSILIGWAADRIGIPAFSYGAGLNLYNSSIMRYFFSKLGAYTLDRRKKNQFYLETLKAYSQLSIEYGVHSLFFPGGTRSRSGRLEEKLKMGLLGSIINAQCSSYVQGKDDKIFLVPLTLNYHFVLEAKNLIEQYLKRTGKELYLVEREAFGGTRNFLKFVWQFFSASSEIVLNFGRPLDALGNFVTDEGQSLDQFGEPISQREYFISRGELVFDSQRNNEYTKILAERLVERYKVENVVLSSHLVAYSAFKLLEREFPQLDLYGLLRLPDEDRRLSKTTFYNTLARFREQLQDLAAAQRVHLSEPVASDSLEALVEHGLSNLGIYHAKKALLWDSKQQYFVSEDLKLLYYYHNRLRGYGLSEILAN